MAQPLAARPKYSLSIAVLIWIYLGLIAIAEVITVLVHPIAGILVHSLLLAAIVVHAALTDQVPVRRLILPLTLAPLTRILSLSMPLLVLPQIFWYPIIYLPLGVAAVIVMRQIGLSRNDAGLNVRKPLLQVLIVPLGLLLGLGEFLILRPEPLISGPSPAQIVFVTLTFAVTTGFIEEFVFRGVLQKVLWERFGWVGIVYSGLLFTVLHLGFLSALDLVFVLGVALFFSWFVHKTGSLMGVSLAHGLTNAGLYMLMPMFLPWLGFAALPAP